MNADNSLWVNHRELNKEKFSEIQAALFGEGMLFDILNIDKKTENVVRPYSWVIKGDEYAELKSLAVSEYVTSKEFTYGIFGEETLIRVKFQFRCYGRFSMDNPNCAIFMEIVEMPENMKRLRVEVDVKCSNKYRQLLRTHILTPENRLCGFQTFDHEEFEWNESLEWLFGVKIFKAEMQRQKDEAVEEETVEEFQDLYQMLSV